MINTNVTHLQGQALFRLLYVFNVKPKAVTKNCLFQVKYT